ncbi:hypothetical protein BKD26_32305 [Streptomyces sp. CB03238]|nr:hypothetical protein BKD26_32305 [Streptomyces sp. CB03238]
MGCGPAAARQDHLVRDARLRPLTPLRAPGRPGGARNARKPPGGRGEAPRGLPWERRGRGGVSTDAETTWPGSMGVVCHDYGRGAALPPKDQTGRNQQIGSADK